MPEERPSYDPEYPCYIRYCLDHNHEMVKPPPKGKRNTKRTFTKEVGKKLVQLFYKGHSPHVARQMLRVDLYSQDTDLNLEEAPVNPLVPDLECVKNSRYNFLKRGRKPYDDPEKYLVELIETYNRETVSGQAVYGLVGKEKFVALCTPIMYRAHKVVPQSCGLMIVDVFSNKDKGPRLYMLGTSGLPGGVPLGCVITESSDQEVVQVGLEQLISILPPASFCGKTWPTVIVANSDLKERDAFTGVWTEATLLTSQSHLMETLWRWLQDWGNNIDVIDRQPMYLAFKKIVDAPNADDLDILYKAHLTRFQKYKSYVKYVGRLYEKRLEWADYYLPRTNSNYLETVLRILKRDIVERIKECSLPHLVEFLLTRYETYTYKRLTDFGQDKLTKELTRKFMPPALKNIDISNILRIEEDETCFYVPCPKTQGVAYFVDAKYGFCSCEQKRPSRLCEHLGAVMQHCCLTEDLFVAPYRLKVSAIEIATGSKPGPQILSGPEQSRNPVARQDGSSVVLVKNAPPSFAFLPGDLETVPDDNCTEPATQSSEEAASAPTTLDNEPLDISEQLDDVSVDLHDYIQLYDEPDSLSQSELEQVQGIFERIISGTETNPHHFIPAVRAMLKTVSESVTTESALVSAVQNFGKSATQSPKRAKRGARASANILRGSPSRKGVKRPAVFEDHYDTFVPVSGKRLNHNQTFM